MTDDLVSVFRKEDRVVCVADTLRPNLVHKADQIHYTDILSPDFDKLFLAYGFDYVVYLFQPLYAVKEDHREFAELEHLLALCCEHEVKRVICVEPKLANGDGGWQESRLSVQFAACNSLCDYYRNNRNMDIFTLFVPSIYGKGENISVAGRMMYDARKEEIFTIAAPLETPCGFVSQLDLGELILRVGENGTAENYCMDVTPGDYYTIEELGDLIRVQYPSLQLDSVPGDNVAAHDFSDRIVKREFDWSPTISLENSIESYSKATVKQKVKNENSRFDAVRQYVKEHKFFVRLAELLVGFVLMELLNRVTQTSVLFQYIDFRLCYIILIGIANGLKWGAGAAFLASCSLVYAMAQNTNSWDVVARDIDTWLPFVFFFLIGTVTGYIKDRLVNENLELAEEQEILESKYKLLNTFYSSSITNKDHFKKQILSYRDSFGRLYDIIRRLDSDNVDEVYSEALSALEEVLENQSICIYYIDGEDYARLIASSKAVKDQVEKSMRLADYPAMIGALSEDEVWTNKARLENYPYYVFPIYREGKLYSMVLIENATYEQMSAYYENMVKIICGLIRMSLIHAIERTQAAEKDIFLPNSRVMNQEHFMKVLKIKDDMSKQGNLDYMLVRLNVPESAYIDVGNTVSNIVRENDIVGIGKDGKLYLCLMQVTTSNIDTVLERLRNTDIGFNNA